MCKALHILEVNGPLLVGGGLWVTSRGSGRGSGAEADHLGQPTVQPALHTCGNWRGGGQRGRVLTTGSRGKDSGRPLSPSVGNPV